MLENIKWEISEITIHKFKIDFKVKNWCFWTVVFEKTLESPLVCKEIQPVHPKGNQSWTFIGRTDAEAEASILWPPDAKNWFFGKDPDAGKDWRQKEMTEDEMVGWHHQLDGHEFEQAPGVGDGQGRLVMQSMGSQSWTWLSDSTELSSVMKSWVSCFIPPPPTETWIILSSRRSLPLAFRSHLGY